MRLTCIVPRYYVNDKWVSTLPCFHNEYVLISGFDINEKKGEDLNILRKMELGNMESYKLSRIEHLSLDIFHLSICKNLLLAKTYQTAYVTALQYMFPKMKQFCQGQD